MMDGSDEHFVPGTSRITEIESFHRYAAAAELCRDCCVLDAASGDGYGCAILAGAAALVTGIDCCGDAIATAQEKYSSPKIRFVCGNILRMPFPDASFDRVVSFETIEHIAEPQKFLAEIRRVLKPDGILLLTSPNRKAFDRRNRCEHGENPFHVHEMEREELETMLREYFPEIAVYGQDAFYNSVISGEGEPHYFVRDSGAKILTQSGLQTVQYSFVLASASTLPRFSGSVFIDGCFEPDYGYCFDDEAVVNQFGLRGEFEKVQRDLAETDRRLSEEQAKCVAYCEQIRSLQGDLAETNQRLRDEHAKAEYLFCEYNELKNAWSLRIFGRFSLRRKLKQAAAFAGAVLHKVGKSIFLKLPGNYRFKQRCKNFLYGHFGRLLRNVKGYQDWRLAQTTQEMLLEQGDTGLIVPPDVPLTSIVIPVYNNLSLTRKCLDSIYRIRSKSPFEIIIADDCSTEDIALLKKDFPLVKIVRNEKNSGFLLTANHGGAAAAGEYLVFLNNDTEVLPGWLDELTTALYHHPEAGMIGSQLIHMATRRLQESGDLVCKNGEMLPLGRGEAPDHPGFSFFREVDFCSAASIILRKKVFEEMHGFDTVYVPAYFEDPDLGLRLQKAGYRNYVMPLSRVLHQEMASYGSALDRSSEKNRQFFNRRWHDYLQEHALYDTPEAMRQTRRFSRPRLLYIDAEVPMADRGSGGMDAIFFMEYFLKRGYEIVFHGEYTPGYVPKYTTILLRMGVECVYEPYLRIWEYLADNGKTFQTLFVSRIYQARCFDRLLKKYAPQATYIFNTVDVHFVRELLEAKLQNSETLLRKAEVTKKLELQVAGAADATIVISSDEKKLLEGEYHLDRVWHIPQARDIFGLAPNQNRRGAVFIGSAHPPNMDGLRYFHDEILPLLPPDFRLTIIGEALKKIILKA